MKFNTRFLITGLAAIGVMAALSGCQAPGFGGLSQTAQRPPPKRMEPPPARGIWIVGSTAVQPRIDAVSVAYEPTPDTQPHVVAEGTAGGFRTLCSGVGVDYPDMTLADRPIRVEELKRCRDKGIALSAYTLGAKQYVYVKDAHMLAIPGVRGFVESWGVPGTPASEPLAPNPL